MTSFLNLRALGWVDEWLPEGPITALPNLRVLAGRWIDTWRRQPGAPTQVLRACESADLAAVVFQFANFEELGAVLSEIRNADPKLVVWIDASGARRNALRAPGWRVRIEGESIVVGRTGAGNWTAEKANLLLAAARSAGYQDVVFRGSVKGKSAQQMQRVEATNTTVRIIPEPLVALDDLFV